METKEKFTALSTVVNNIEQRKKTFTRGAFSSNTKNDIIIAPSVFERMYEMKVKKKWKEVVGPMFANAATSIVLNNKLLIVTVNSAAIRNELLLNKTAIINRMNEELKKHAVSEIIFK